jgi:hypothetical protein
MWEIRNRKSNVTFLQRFHRNHINFFENSQIKKIVSKSGLVRQFVDTMTLLFGKNSVKYLCFSAHSLALTFANALLLKVLFFEPAGCFILSLRV